MPSASAAAQRYAEAVRSLAGAMERLRSLQAALTEANTAEAFEQIAKAAFPRAAIEQYQDQLTELQFTYKAVSTNADAVFDPERTALEASRLAQIAIANRELDQIKAGNFNLDLKNPHNPDEGPGDVDHLLPEYEKLLARIAETRGKLKAQLMEALKR